MNRRNKYRIARKILILHLEANFLGPLVQLMREREDDHIRVEEYENQLEMLPRSYEEYLRILNEEMERRTITESFDMNEKHDDLFIRRFFKEGRDQFLTINEWLDDHDLVNNLGGNEPLAWVNAMITVMRVKKLYPLYADPNDEWKLKPFEIEDFRELFDRRRKNSLGILKHIGTMGSQFTESFPLSGQNLIDSAPALTEGDLDHVYKLPVKCPKCHKEFTSQQEMEIHFSTCSGNSQMHD